MCYVLCPCSQDDMPLAAMNTAPAKPSSSTTSTNTPPAARGTSTTIKPDTASITSDHSDSDTSEDVAAHVDITIRDALIALRSELTPAEICLRALQSTHTSLTHDCRMIQALMSWKPDAGVVNTNKGE